MSMKLTLIRRDTNLSENIFRSCNKLQAPAVVLFPSHKQHPSRHIEADSSCELLPRNSQEVYNGAREKKDQYNRLVLPEKAATTSGLVTWVTHVIFETLGLKRYVGSRMHACQLIMKMVPGKKPPEVANLLVAMIDWLESTKNANHGEDGFTDETAAHALIEQYALQLFTFADQQDRAMNFNKNTIKAFYTAGILMDMLEQFDELSEDIMNKRKYAKWKAAYIHNCLKSGEIPLPGGPNEQNAGDNDSEEAEEPNDYTPTIKVEPQSPQPPVAPNSMDGPVAPAPASSPITPSGPSNPVPPASVPSVPSNISSGTIASLGSDVIQKAQKYCKYATSALNYDDVNTAVDNLTRALALLKTGKED